MPGANGHFCMSQQCLGENDTSFAEIFAVASITLQPNKIENFLRWAREVVMLCPRPMHSDSTWRPQALPGISRNVLRKEAKERGEKSSPCICYPHIITFEGAFPSTLCSPDCQDIEMGICRPKETVQISQWTELFEIPLACANYRIRAGYLALFCWL